MKGCTKSCFLSGCLENLLTALRVIVYMIEEGAKTAGMVDKINKIFVTLLATTVTSQWVGQQARGFRGMGDEDSDEDNEDSVLGTA